MISFGLDRNFESLTCQFANGIMESIGNLERINYSPYGLFCDNQCIKQFEESDDYILSKVYKEQNKQKR